uniref:Non-structural maintenance of chromosomes element 1 homolog n=2 Tax=Lygus hesperus TaxID=30085 RepID=A0A0A9Y398_LYGHE
MASDDHCKTILQFFMLERVITVSSLADLMERITGSASNSDALINKINERIQEFSQKIVKATCEVTGDKMYVMIFTADEADVKSQLTKDQIDYFYPLMNNIITSSGSLALITALNMAPAVTMARVSLADAEKYIELFVLKRLLLLENGFLYLSPLTIAEFGPYITENYALDPCMLCKKMLVFGESCPSCSAPIHVQCFKDFLQNSKKAVKCPQCKEQLSVAA